MYKLPIEKSDKKQSQHMRTSKTGKVYSAGAGAKKEDKNIKLVKEAIRDYTTLDQNNSKLIELMDNNPQAIEDFAKQTQKKLKDKGIKSVRAVRGSNSSYFLSILEDVGSIPNETMGLGRIKSFSKGMEKVDVFSGYETEIHVNIPIEDIFYHYEEGDSLSFSNEKEIIVLDKDLLITSISSDTEYDTGNKIVTAVYGKILDKE